MRGRAKGQSTITCNEILYALHQADKFLLAIVIVDGDRYDWFFTSRTRSKPNQTLVLTVFTTI